MDGGNQPQFPTGTLKAEQANESNEGTPQRLRERVPATGREGSGGLVTAQGCPEMRAGPGTLTRTSTETQSDR